MPVIRRCLWKKSQKGSGYILTLTVITTFDWFNDVTNLRHDAIATSASSDKIAFVLHLFDALYAFKSSNNA